jgi:putative hydrolase of the HAD superfamily
MPHELDQVRAVVFDAVGTLLYADPPVADVYHLAGWQHGSQLSRDEVASRLRAALAMSEAGKGLVREATSARQERTRWQQIVASVIDDVHDESGAMFDGLWRHFADAAHWRLFDDAAAAIDELAARGWRLAIASNFDRRLHAIAEQFPALARCQRRFISSEIGYPKPDRRFFAAIEAELDLPSQQLLLVGDDWTNDILGAQAAGWQTIWLHRRGTPATQPHIRSVLELLDLLAASTPASWSASGKL